jgi:hypothetical protein
MRGPLHVHLVVVTRDHDARRVAPKPEGLEDAVQLLDAQRATDVPEVPEKKDASSARTSFGVCTGQHLLAYRQRSVRNVDV